MHQRSLLGVECLSVPVPSGGKFLPDSARLYLSQMSIEYPVSSKVRLFNYTLVFKRTDVECS